MAKGCRAVGMVSTSMRWQTGFQGRGAAGQEGQDGAGRAASKWGRTEEEAGGREPPAAALGRGPCSSTWQSCPGRCFSISTYRKAATGQKEAGVFVTEPEKRQALRNRADNSPGSKGPGAAGPNRSNE